MTDISVRSALKALAPYVPGKPIASLARERHLALENIAKLASNENPLGFSPAVERALQAQLSRRLGEYPDDSAIELTAALAAHYQLETSQVLLGAGSSELIFLAARTVLDPGTEALMSQHSFVLYGLAAQLSGANSVVVPSLDWGHDLQAMAAALNSRTRVVFIANPNNPTGTFLAAEAVRQFLEAVPPQVLVVLDEAYTEYLSSSQASPAVSWLQRYPNLLVLRTFSKAYGLASLRVGYALGAPDLIAWVGRTRPPFNVSSLAQQAALAALADQAFVQTSREANERALADLVDIANSHRLSYTPSATNFLLVHFGRAVEPIYQGLLDRGLITRPFSDMPHSLRISTGLPQQQQRLRQAFTEIL